jgi:hypothetical protein
MTTFDVRVSWLVAYCVVACIGATLTLTTTSVQVLSFIFTRFRPFPVGYQNSYQLVKVGTENWFQHFLPTMTVNA